MVRVASADSEALSPCLAASASRELGRTEAVVFFHFSIDADGPVVAAC